MNTFFASLARGDRNQRGFSSIETAIIFVAFVTLAAVFGFSVVTTGVLTRDASKQSILQGLKATSGALIQSGAVIGVANADKTALESVRFQITNASSGTDGVNLSPDLTVVSYIDGDQFIRLTPDQWTATWLTGFGALINPGERVEISVDLTGLNPPLGTSKEFFIELFTGDGASLRLRRVTPPALPEIFDIP